MSDAREPTASTAYGENPASGRTAGSPAELSLTGGSAIVTGAASGIGRDLARGLAAHGMRLTLADVSPAVDDVAASIRDDGEAAVAVRADVSDEDDVDLLVRTARETHDGIDVLVNNAGISVSATVLDLRPADWRRVLEVNLTGTFLCAQAAGKVMAEQGGGVVINVASQLGEVARPERAAYCTSKAGVLMLTRALAVDLGPSGIRVNALAPGPIEVDRTRPMLQQEGPGSYRSRMLLGRHGRPSDLLGAVVLLASPASAFMTGSVVVVDGGYLAT